MNHRWRSRSVSLDRFCVLLALVSATLLPSEADAQPFAYVANDVSHNVSVINTATNTPVTTITIGASSLPASVATSPDGTRVYVANNPAIADQGTVSVIDTATNTVTATIATGGGPYGIAITPNGSALYVTNFYGNLPNDDVWVISTATNTVIQTVTVGSGPHGIAVTPNGARVYVANTGSDTVSVIDTATHTVSATVPVGHSPHGVAVSPNGLLAYVSNYDEATVSVISTATDTVMTTIPMATDKLEGITFSKDGSLAYVSHQHSNFVSIIETATHTVVGTVTVGTGPFGSALTPDGLHLYVASQATASVSVINTQTHTVVATVPTAPGSFPENVAITPAVASFQICPLYDTTKAAKSGSTIPIKLQLCDSAGANLSSPTIVVQATSVTLLSSQISGPVEDAGQANPDNNFRYDAALGGTGGYIFNLSTKGLTTGTYAVNFIVSGDTGSYSTTFQVK